MGRIVNIEELKRERERARREGKTFVFTNGCFDLIHRGHIELLRAAHDLGDILTVAINSDDSVRRLKGPQRPIIRQEDRSAILAAICFVDYVLIFEEDTPEEVISVLLPDVIVKGADYEINEIVGREQVESSGGRVVRIPLLEGYSTERLLRMIAERYR